jgi:predicted esterase
MRTLTTALAAPALFVLLAGCSDDASTATPDDAGLPGDEAATTSGDGGATSGDGSTVGNDGGTSTDGAASDSGNAGPGPGPTQQCAFTKDAQGFFKLTSTKSDYWVRLPANYNAAAPQPAPLLVAIHGCGDTAYNFATWGAAPYALRATQDYIAISIGGRESQCWTVGTDGPIVTEAIAHVRSCFYAHQKKIVLAGYSSGGMLAYSLGMKNAGAYAGILIENSGLTQGVGNPDTALAGAAWKINVAHSARTEDQSFLIAGVRTDRDKMVAAGFPLQYRELPGTHDGSTDDWALFLIPKMAAWSAP